jgi:hypothetical protein
MDSPREEDMGRLVSSSIVIVEWEEGGRVVVIRGGVG